MVAEYMQSGNISFIAWKKVKEEIEDYIQNGMGRCSCGPLSITVGTDRQGVYYTAMIRCECGVSGDFGEIQGTVPVE